MIILKDRRAWLGIVLSLFCLGVIFWSVDLNQVWAALVVANWRVWPAVLLAYLAFMLLRAWRWQIMLSASVSYWSVFHAQSIGYLLTNILPFRLGEVARAYIIGQQPEVSSLQALSTVALERILDMLIIVLLFSLSLPFVPVLPPFVSQAGFSFGIITLFSFGLLLAAAWQRARALHLLAALLRHIPYLELEIWLKRADTFFDGIQVLTNWRLFVPVAGLSLAVWLAAIVTFYWGIAAFWPGVSWVAAIFTLCAAGFGLSIPSSPSGVGVFHASIWLVLPIFAATETQALGFAFVYHAFTLVIIIILGGIGIWQSGQSLSQVATNTQHIVFHRQFAKSADSRS